MSVRLGELLVERGVLDAEQLAEALEDQQVTGRVLGKILIAKGFATETEVMRTLAEQAGMPFVELSEAALDPAALALLSAPLCRRHHVIPVGMDGNRLQLAMSNPGDVLAKDDITSVVGRDISVVVASRTDIDAAIDRVYRAADDLDSLSEEAGPEEQEEDLGKIKEVTEDAPIVKFVNLLIAQGIQDGASDIHLEPQESEMQVRFRIDGVLHVVMRPSKRIQSGIISRLKIMSDINIAERRIPQDGRLSVNHNGKKVDLRVATLPTVWGEKVVMRILDNSTARLDLQDLGFSEHNLARYQESFSKPYGMIMVTGPTGSGKSTTLYATLNVLNRPEVNIITVEDPVEYRLPGIAQIQTHPKAGLTFAAALRSILRADPDIVLIGEVRDHETAMIAVEAALTGHLVLTTLHTNDAPSAVSRLIEMGVEPFLVGSSLDCVLAQRLARRLCPKCKEEYEPTPEALRVARIPWEPGSPLPTLYRAVGCSYCARTGYRGRMALHEVMQMNEALERLTVEQASTAQIQQEALRAGMQSLRDDGINKVLAGMTSVDEILRVVN